MRLHTCACARVRVRVCVRACVCACVSARTADIDGKKHDSDEKYFFLGGGYMHVEGFDTYAPMTTLIYCPIVGITAAVRFQNKPISQICSDCDDVEISLTTPKLVGNTNHLGFETAAFR
jgi:hypothetical protein